MIRFEKIISKVYDLGKCKQNPTQAQDDVIKFLRGDTDGYNTKRWYFTKCHKSHSSSLVDHIEYFETAVVFIPYCSTEYALKDITTSERWQLAIEHGLTYRIEKANPCIFEDPKFAESTIVIIIQATNWNACRNAIRQQLHDEFMKQLED